MGERNFAVPRAGKSLGPLDGWASARTGGSILGDPFVRYIGSTCAWKDIPFAINDVGMDSTGNWTNASLGRCRVTGGCLVLYFCEARKTRSRTPYKVEI